MQDLLAFQAIWRCGISKKKKKKRREGQRGPLGGPFGAFPSLGQCISSLHRSPKRIVRILQRCPLNSEHTCTSLQGFFPFITRPCLSFKFGDHHILITDTCYLV